MTQLSIAMILLSKGGLEGGGGGLGILILLVVLLAVLGLGASLLATPFIGAYTLMTHNSEGKLDYDGPLALGAKIVVGVFSLAILIGILSLVKFESILIEALFALLLIFAAIFCYLVWNHFYFRHLYTLGNEGAQRSIRILFLTIGVITILIIVVLVYNSVDRKIERFDRAIVKAEQSPELQTGCMIPDIHLGMSHEEYCNVVARMEKHDSVRTSDSGGETLYLVYSTDCDRSMSMETTFVKGKLAMLHLGDYGGFGSSLFKEDVRQSGILQGYKHLEIPSVDIKRDGTIRYPRHMHDFCTNYELNLLYNYDDYLFVKDNMLIVFTPLGVSFINMPQMTGY